MLRKIKKESITLSSNWYKKYKGPYLLLIFDISILLVVSFFTLKEYLIGSFDKVFSPNSLLILLLILILMIFRFNLSLLMFSKQLLGIYISAFFLILLFFMELYYIDGTSPLLYLFGSIVFFINKFLIKLPVFIGKAIQYFLYIYTFYFPILFYFYFVLFKKEINNDARKFDVITGFYASTLSSKLKIIDIVVVASQIGLAMSIGLISNNINWAYLAIPISLYSVYDLIKRAELKDKLTRIKKHIIYILIVLFSFGIIYTQKTPYVGLIFFISAIVIMYIIISIQSKSYLKSALITSISLFVIPSFCLGYNIFAYPQYGVINKSIPFGGEKIFYTVIDKEGYLGIRNRGFKIIKPTYRVVDYKEKNNIRLLNKNCEWEIYNLEKDIYLTKSTGEVIITPY